MDISEIDAGINDISNDESFNITINNFIRNESRDNIFNEDNLNIITKKYQRILILCLKNDSEYNNEILNYNVINIKDIISNYTLITAPIRLIKKINLDMFILLNKNILELFFNQSFEDEEIILPMYRAFESSVHLFMKQYLNINTLEEYIKLLMMNSYLDIKKIGQQEKKNRLNIIQNIEEKNYWTLIHKVNQNNTIKFYNRRFHLRESYKLNDKQLQDLLDFIDKKEYDKDIYLSGIYCRRKYVDASSSIQANGYKLYYITKHPLQDKLTTDDFNKLLNILIKNNLDEELYYLIMNTMVSKELCHLVVNNKYFWQLIKNNILIKYAPIIKYCLSYAWLTFYMEESIMRTKITKNERFIFDIETASELPFYPFDITDPLTSPYLPIMVSATILDMKENCLGLDQYYIKDNNKLLDPGYGVCKLEEFKRRLNIFITGKDIDIFENINWNNIAISGSCMAACLPNFNPLHLYYKNTYTNQINFDAFFDQYYGKSDIDIMCNIVGIDYITHVYELYEKIKQNIKNKINKDTITEINYVKTATIVFNIEYLKKNIVSDDLKLEDILQDLDNEIIKNKLYKIYIDSKIKNISEYLNNDYWVDPKYNSYFEIVPYDKVNVALYQPKDQNKIENEEYFRYNENIKFKINNSNIKKSLEIFCATNGDFFGTVARFHLPVVRSYYTGDNVYMTPSAISAYMTFLNIDYKYFAGTQDPIEIINKYRYRGFGILLNNDEKVKLIEYSSNVETWKKLYSINIINNNNIKKILGTKFYTDIFYMPNNVNIVPNFNYITNNNLNTVYDNIYPIKKINDINFWNLRCINENGYVITLKDNYISLGYDLL